MKPWKSTAALSFTLLALTACSEPGDPSHISSNLNQGLTYDFTENGCPTGRQTFNSLTDLCVGLQNNTLNNDCALNLRAEHFRRSCQGQTFSPFDAPNGGIYNPGQPDPSYGGQADIHISGFRNLNLRLDSTQNAGRVACIVEGREFRLELDHPDYSNLGPNSRLLELHFKAPRNRKFPTRLSIDGRGRDSSLSVLLPGDDGIWSPRRESCEVDFRRQGRNLEASFDCRLDGRLHGRRQTIRMNTSVNCEIDRR